MFQTFLTSEFSDENLEFWLVCEDYKKIRSSFRTSSRARKIFKRYVQADAAREVKRHILPCRNRPPLTALPPADQHRSQDQRGDQAERGDAHAALLRRRPDDRLRPDGERLVPALPQVRLLPPLAGLGRKDGDVKKD